MYVDPAARGRGVGKAVLATLEDTARERGWTTLRLETGPRQPEAIGLYTGAGYRPSGAFCAYVGHPDAEGPLFFERLLDPV
jgi:GNAT superfamily N-acetyltransferase